VGVGGGLTFFEVLYFFRVRQGDVDRIGWSPSKRSNFEVKPFHQVLISPNGSCFPCKSIGKVKDPLRVAYLGKILTLDNLSKMNIDEG
jgi:hypothetical protein